ncbi:MAG: ADP-ribosylglycohydrolase family protein [Chloroflexota bacterium]
MPLPNDYVERVYAGVLGKLIGVYLGRPFEGWPQEMIEAKLGEINYYVHENLEVPLIVTDDDITGTFTFIRALSDYGNTRDLTPAQIGQTWLNYLVEEKTGLWWGGMGASTEHTAYLRLKEGYRAPESGSIALNSQVVAEQIGAQIFIDGWAMVAPADPELAADLARRAGSVSHDGEAVYGAQVLAAMESQAFIEKDIDTLIDVGISVIPKDSLIYKMIGELREFHATEPDWRKAREWLAAHYGPDKYGGGVHIMPNHSLIILALLYGADNFQRSLMIVNTSGWDTDCNSGNLGCLLGIKNGLETIDAGLDWRTPIADRLYRPSADGGSVITDAGTVTLELVNMGRALAGEAPMSFKSGARFHFELPGSVQGFMSEESVEAKGVAQVENVIGHSQTGKRSLAIHFSKVAPGRVAQVTTHTFIPSKEEAVFFENYMVYPLLASPSLYSGQTVQAVLQADATNESSVTAGLYVQAYGPDDILFMIRGPQVDLDPGANQSFTWQMPDTKGAPIAKVGVEISSDDITNGTVYLDYLTWDGTPQVTLGKIKGHDDVPPIGDMWRRAWIYGLDDKNWTKMFELFVKILGKLDLDPSVVFSMFEAFSLTQNKGRGLLIQGARDWTDYRVSAEIKPHMIKATGLGARVQGLRRYYALLLSPQNKLCLLKALDGDTVLAETDFEWQYDVPYMLTLQVKGNRLQGYVNDQVLIDVVDTDRPLDGGGIALVCEEGRMVTNEVVVGLPH